MLVDTDYFKKISQDMFYQSQPTAWDLSQIKHVENTHFYLDIYQEMADQCFYIDYPDHLQDEIMKIYSYKIFRNDMEKFLARHLSSLHASLQSKVNDKNALEVFNILWLKSLKSWRDRSDLLRISLADFFDQTKMISLVETIIKDKIKHPGKFDMVYSQWMEKNQTMKEIFKRHL